MNSTTDIRRAAAERSVPRRRPLEMRWTVQGTPGATTLVARWAVVESTAPDRRVAA